MTAQGSSGERKGTRVTFLDQTGAKSVDAVIAELEPWIPENAPEAMVRVRKYGVGPSNTWKFEVRISGPAEADRLLPPGVGWATTLG